MEATSATEENIHATEALSGKRSDSRQLAAVALYILLLGFGFQGTRHLWQPDEGYNAAVTLEMLDSGNPLIQTIDHQVYLGKPPGHIWGTIPGVLLFGRNEWGIRAFCAACFVLTCWIVGLQGASLWSRREGILSALIYATMLLPFAAANVARPDTPLVLATTAAFYCFWRSAMPDARHASWWKMAMCAVLGWGFVVKSTAVLVPVAPMFCYLLLTRQTLRYFLTPWAVVGALIFALTGLSWYVYMSKAVPGAGAYLWDSNVTGRLVTATYHHHPGLIEGIEVYAPVLLAGPLPWLLAWYPLSTRVNAARGGQSLREVLRSNPRITLLLLWLFLPLCVYFAASSKLPLYPLPVFAPIALLTARALTEFMPAIFGSEYPTRRVWTGLIVWGAILLSLKLGAAYFPSNKDEGAVWDEIRQKAPPNISRIYVIDEDLDGLRLYTQADIMRLAVSKESGDPPFVPLPLIEEGLGNVNPSNGPYAIITNKHLRQKNRLLMLELLRKANLQFEELPLNYERTLILCREKRQ